MTAVAFSTHAALTPATGSTATSGSMTVVGPKPVIIVTIALSSSTATVSAVSWSKGSGTPYEVANTRQGDCFISVWAIPAPALGAGTYTVTLSASVPYQADGAAFVNAAQNRPAYLVEAATLTATSGATMTLTPKDTSSQDAVVGGAGNTLGFDPTGVTPNSTFFDATTAINLQAGYRIGIGSIVANWSTVGGPNLAGAAVRVRAAQQRFVRSGSGLL